MEGASADQDGGGAGAGHHGKGFTIAIPEEVARQRALPAAGVAREEEILSARFEKLIGLFLASA